MTLDLNLLLTFEALDQARSVSGAARRLGLSQPATSAALQRLRAALGDQLFIYAGGAMQPTPMARRLAPELHAVLAQMRALLDNERRFDPATARGAFRVGVTDYASAVIAPPLLRYLAQAAPGMDLHLLAYDKTEVAALIDGGALDLVIGSFASPPDRAVATPLLQEHFVGVARADHPARAAPMDVARFASLHHALYTLGRDARGVVDDRLAALGKQRRVALALPHLMALPEALRARDLVAVVPARAARLFGPGIAEFDLDFLDLAPWLLHMLWSPAARRDPAQVFLRGAVQQVCAGL